MGILAALWLARNSNLQISVFRETAKHLQIKTTRDQQIVMALLDELPEGRTCIHSAVTALEHRPARLRFLITDGVSTTHIKTPVHSSRPIQVLHCGKHDKAAADTLKKLAGSKGGQYRLIINEHSMVTSLDQMLLNAGE